MKKFTKGCLWTALILVIVGFVITCVCGVLGGFRQLRQLEDADGILYNPGGVFWRGSRDVGEDWSRQGYTRLLEGEENAAFSVPGSRLDLEVADCNLYLEESEDDRIQLYVEGDELRYYYMIDGETLRIRNEGFLLWGNHSWSDDIHIRIPKGYRFEEIGLTLGEGICRAPALQAGEIILEIGAGVCEVTEMTADQADISVGAGQVNIEDMTVETTEIVAGAGQIDIGRLTAETAEAEVGVGQFSVEKILASRLLDLEVGMGSAEVGGTITGNLSLECDMGETQMHLTGSEDDHSYDVECGMGEVTIGSNGHGGFAAKRTWNDGKKSCFEVNCNMGNVTITFEE